MAELGATAPPARAEASVADAIVRLERRRDFRIHLFVYLAWSIFLAVVWLMTERQRTGTWPGPFSDQPGVAGWSPWLAYPVFGWGIVVAFHAFVTYRRPVTARDVEDELRRLRGETVGSGTEDAGRDAPA